MQIGPRLVQQLLDGFLYHDLSLNSFLHRVQLVVLQHFISLPVSVLCCAVDLLAVSPWFFRRLVDLLANVSLLPRLRRNHRPMT